MAKKKEKIAFKKLEDKIAKEYKYKYKTKKRAREAARKIAGAIIERKHCKKNRKAKGCKEFIEKHKQWF